MSASPNNPGDLVTFTIKAAGSPISGSINVIAVTIEKQLNTPATAQFVLTDGDAADGTFEISSSNLFVPGVEIVIEAGYDGSNHLLFKGNVTVQNIRLDASASTLTVECRSMYVENRAINTSPVLSLAYGESILALNANLSRPDDTFKLQGTVKFQGASIAVPGKYISLAGLGDRFSGDHLMSAVVHRIEEGNWITEATIGLAE